MTCDYRLDDLGWYQFERLCQALLRSGHGAVLEAWGGTKDGGKDAYAPGRLTYPDPKISTAGPFLFQAKFVAEANATGSNPGPALLKAVKAEARRILDRIDQGTWCHPRYFTLMTNVPLSEPLRGQVKQALQSIMPDTEILQHGAADIAAMLDRQPQVRLSYPQILGLRDLEALLKQSAAADVINRSTLTLESAARLAQVFVPTGAYAQAISLLSAGGFAVLTGPPEMGKTATARIIALARYTAGWEAYECRGPDDLFKVYRRDASQIFVADDAFGSTEYRPDIAEEWAAVLDRIIDSADYRHAVIWTSRPAPLKEGLRQLHLQGSARTFPKPAEVQVDASRLSIAEKAQMLYRHTKAANLPKEATAVIRSRAVSIVYSEHFTPLRIERFVREDFPRIMAAPSGKRSALIEEAIETGMQTPTQAMRTSYEALDEELQAVLIGMLNHPGNDVSLDALGVEAERFLGRPLSRSIVTATNLLDEHFVRSHQARRLA